MNLQECHFWIDESGTPNLKGDEEHFSIGMLYGYKPITEEYIKPFWEKFLSDPDTNNNSKDAIARRRGFFHASEDSPNAHSPCCRAVHNLTGYCFEYIGFEKGKAHAGTEWLTTRESVFHQHMVELITTFVARIPAIKFVFQIAQRKKSFPEGTGDLWVEEYYKKRLRSACTTPQLSMPFPHIVVEMVAGDDSGVQLADFLLWAAMRKRFMNENTWLGRSGFIESKSMTIEGEPLFGNHFENQYQFNPNPNIPPIENIRIPDGRQTLDRYVGLMFHAEKQLRYFKQNPVVHARHWLPQVVAPLDNLDTKTGDMLDILQKMAKAYMYLVDTVPFYDPANKEEVHAAIDTKYWMEKFIYKPNYDWVLENINHWMYNRARFEKTQPELLGLVSKMD